MYLAHDFTLLLVIGRRPHLPCVCELAEVVSCPGDVHVARQADRLALVLALGPRQLLTLAVYQLSDPSQPRTSQTVSVLETFDNVHSPEQHGRPGLVAEAGPGGVGGLGRAHGGLHILGHGVGQVGVHAARGGVHAGGEETIQ